MKRKSSRHQNHGPDQEHRIPTDDESEYGRKSACPDHGVVWSSLCPHFTPWVAGAGRQAAGTPLNVTASGTGAEILCDGTLVAANHFGNASDGMQAAASVTLANGLTFGTSVAHMTPGGWGVPPSWTPLHATASDAHGKVPLLTDVNYRTLMRSYFWIAYGDSVSQLDIPGLTPGRPYRLQLISPKPSNCLVSVEGGPAVTWSGSFALATDVQLDGRRHRGQRRSEPGCRARRNRFHRLCAARYNAGGAGRADRPFSHTPATRTFSLTGLRHPGQRATKCGVRTALAEWCKPTHQPRQPSQRPAWIMAHGITSEYPPPTASGKAPIPPRLAQSRPRC